jgi:predicted metal-dependent HD superfamily phosphohydrolase
VLERAVDIAKMEGIKDEEELLLLQLGALYHDVGFLEVYSGHEEVSCNVARAELTDFGFSDMQIEKVAGLIRATKVPQQPQTILEQIICDADLDYLGRDDFFKIGKGLYKEFVDQNIVSDDKTWNLLQVRFLESHHYFTNTSIKLRQEQKQKHLDIIKNSLV